MVSKKKVLITGGGGFVGLNTIVELQKKHPEWILYNLNRSPVSFKGVINISCDAENFNFAELSDLQFDYIIHLLALSNDKFCDDFSRADDINVGFTKKLLKFAKSQKKLKKFIHLSSIIIYDNNNTPPVKEGDQLFLNYNVYSLTKGISEYYVNFYKEKFDLPIVVFRLSNIYGPYQSFDNSPFLVPSKIVQAAEEDKIEVFNLSPKRDWIYSGDAAEAIVRALTSGISGVYNLAGGKGYSVEDIVKEIAAYFQVDYSSLDKPVTGPLNFYCDISKLKKDLGWRPKTTLEEGLRTTIEHYKND